MLVLPDAHADAAAELCQLQHQHQEDGSHTSAATITRLVATVLRYLQQRQAADAAGPATAAEGTFNAAYPPSATVKVAAVAQRLVSLAVRARWPAVARLMLPAITADGSSTAAAMRQLNALSAPAPSLIHLAVASGSADTLAALRSWASRQGMPWEEMAAAGASLPRSLDLLLLAAAMGSALDEQMVEQLAGESTAPLPGAGRGSTMGPAARGARAFVQPHLLWDPLPAPARLLSRRRGAGRGALCPCG